MDTNCPHCQKKVSTYASRCNHCSGEMKDAIVSCFEAGGFLGFVSSTITLFVLCILLGLGYHLFLSDAKFVLTEAIYNSAIFGVAAIFVIFSQKVKA